MQVKISLGLIFLFGICRLEWEKKNLDFFFFFWLGHVLGPNSKRGPRGPWGPAGAGLGSGKKTRYPKRGGSESRVLPCGTGPDMEKSGPNPTRCHSYLKQGKHPLELSTERKPCGPQVFSFPLFAIIKATFVNCHIHMH